MPDIQHALAYLLKLMKNPLTVCSSLFFKRPKKSVCLVFMALMSHSHLVTANDLANAARVQSKLTDADKLSQIRIDTATDNIESMRNDLIVLKEKIAVLKVYKDYQTGLIADQQAKIDTLSDQKNELDALTKTLVPLMFTMISELEIWIEQDLPIKKEERLERLEAIKQVMDDADVTLADKFQQILDAYLFEWQYGNEYTFSTSFIDIEGETRFVELMQLGRLVLLARSPDFLTYWHFDKNENVWVRLSADTHPHLKKAFELAQSPMKPELIKVPLSLSLAPFDKQSAQNHQNLPPSYQD